MAIGNMDLYKALKEAGASEETAAKSVAGQLPRFWAVTGILATLAALNLGLLWLQVQALERLASVEHRVAAVEQRLDGFEQRFVGFEQRLDGFEQRFMALEQRGAERHAEIMQRLELLTRGQGGSGQ